MILLYQLSIEGGLSRGQNNRTGSTNVCPIGQGDIGGQQVRMWNNSSPQGTNSQWMSRCKHIIKLRDRGKTDIVFTAWWQSDKSQELVFPYSWSVQVFLSSYPLKTARPLLAMGAQLAREGERERERETFSLSKRFQMSINGFPVTCVHVSQGDPGDVWI